MMKHVKRNSFAALPSLSISLGEGGGGFPLTSFFIIEVFGLITANSATSEQHL